MQNVLNSSPYSQYQPYQQFYPQYNQNYYQTPQISTVDWKFVNDCNPDMIRAVEDIDKMNQILSLLSKSDFQSDSQTNQNPNILKLLLLAQIVINYLLKCQEELKDANNELQKNSKSTDYYKSKLGKAIVVLKKSKTRERCPTCHKTFQSSQDLDQHMRTIHNELWSEWVAIRKGKKLPVTSQKESKLQKQVNKLQKQVEDLTAKQRSQYYHDSYNDNKPKRPEPTLFNSRNDARYANISSDEVQPPSHLQPQPQQPQPPLVTQTFLKPDETENLAKLNAKRHAEDFLSQRRSATPMHPKQVDEIVQKISSMLHEQSKQISYGEAVKEENPEELKQDISDDVKSDHPMPKTSTVNNLKDIKKPLQSPKKKQKKKTQQEDEKPEPKEKPKPKEKPEQNEKPEQQQQDDHCYGDSMPLSSSSLINNNFIFSSEIAQYDSTAVPSSSPKPKNQEDSQIDEEESQSAPKLQQNQKNIQNSDVQNDSEISFQSESGHSKFVMPSNDYDFSIYEEFISGDESYNHSNSHRHNEHHPGSTEEEEAYYYDPDDEEAVEAPTKPKVKPDVDTKPDEEVEYSYTYEEEIPDTKGFIHPSPQPSNKSLKTNLDDEELSF